MASVVDTTVKSFNSTMVNAPVMTGAAGTLIGVLDACLVNGFDTKTLTGLAVAAGVATATFAGTHSAQVDSVVLIAGSSIAALNGEQKVTVAPGSLTVKFATAAADGTATGTLTMKMAPAGWAKPFSGTNLAVYQSMDVASTRMFLRVDDTGATVARVVGYEQMSDVNTGTGLFPTAAQIVGGGNWPKSYLVNATAIPWLIHADARIFYATNASGVSSSASYVGQSTRCFGDMTPYRPGGDSYACALSFSRTGGGDMVSDGAVGAAATLNNFAAPRSHTGLGSSVYLTKLAFTGGSAASGLVSSAGMYPSEVDGSLLLAKCYLSMGALFAPRGELPGVLHCPQGGTFDSIKPFDRSAGTGPLTGRTIQLVTTSASSFSNGTSSTYNGTMGIDITGPWR